MEEKRIVKLLTMSILIIFLGCKTANVPHFKKYRMKEKFINIKGLSIPEVTSERKVFNPTKELRSDMKNSLPINRVDILYGNNGYREAIKHHLIKSTAVNVKAYSYNEVVSDETYSKPNTKHNIREYNYSESDILKYIGETNMQVIPLKAKIFTGDTTYSEFISEVLTTYICVFNYYPNGQLHHYSCRVRDARAGTRSVQFNDTAIGNEYDFDPSGNLLMEMDHEEGFNIDFSNLLTTVLMGRNEISEKYKKNIGEGVALFNVGRNKNNFGSFWIASYGIGAHRRIYKIIDAGTGQIIDEFENDENKLKKYEEKTDEYIRNIKELRKSF